MINDRFAHLEHMIESGRYFTHGYKKPIHCYGGKYTNIILLGDLP